MKTGSEDEGNYIYVFPQWYTRQKERYAQTEARVELHAQEEEQENEVPRQKTLPVSDEDNHEPTESPSVDQSELPATSVAAELTNPVCLPAHRDRHPPRPRLYDHLGIPTCATLLSKPVIASQFSNQHVEYFYNYYHEQFRDY